MNYVAKSKKRIVAHYKYKLYYYFNLKMRL